jgi:hypothetical protein
MRDRVWIAREREAPADLAVVCIDLNATRSSKQDSVDDLNIVLRIRASQVSADGSRDQGRKDQDNLNQSRPRIGPDEHEDQDGLHSNNSHFAVGTPRIAQRQVVLGCEHVAQGLHIRRRARDSFDAARSDELDYLQR